MSDEDTKPEVAPSHFDRARRKVLISGLSDWVSLSDVDGASSFGEPVATKQQLTLRVIRSLIDDGLMRLGDLAGPDGRFRAWACSPDEAMQRVRDLYIDHYDDVDVWIWRVWLDLTETGENLAHQLELSD
ncbi:MAG: hypothetical protein WA988_07825 [Candidatus Nanopelagicales bacterium]